MEQDSVWPEGYNRWEAVVDNQELARWCNGRSGLQSEHRNLIEPIVRIFSEIVLASSWRPRQDVCDWVTWRQRQLNTESDELSNLAMDRRQSCMFVTKRLAKRVSLQDVALQCWSDGGHRGRGTSSAGVVIKAWHKAWEHPLVLVAAAKFIEDETVDSTKAEIEALRLAAKLLKQVIRYRRLDATAVQEYFPSAAEVDVQGKVV